MKGAVFLGFALFAAMGLLGVPALETGDHLVIDGHDVDAFLDTILNKSLRPFATRLVECTPELKSLRLNDVNRVLKTVDYSLQVLTRQELIEHNANGGCSDEVIGDSSENIVGTEA